MKKTWKEIKLISLDRLYGGSYADYKKAVKEGCIDDRSVFVNMYEQIVRAVSNLPDDIDPYVRVAMWRQINRDKETLNSIMAKFCD